MNKFNKEKVIVFPIHASSWPTMSQLALKMKEEGRYEPVILLTEGLIEHAEFCRRFEIEAYFFDVQCSSVGRSNATGNTRDETKKFYSPKSTLFGGLRKAHQSMLGLFDYLEKKTKNGIFSYSLYQILRIPFEVIYQRVYLKVSDRLLARIRPKAVYMYVDNLGSNFASFAAVCRKRSIKIILPAAAFQHQEVPACRRKKTPYMTVGQKGAPWLNYWIKKHFPEQVYNYDGIEVLFYRPYEMVAMWLSGTLVKYPWVRGKNYCDVVCVEDGFQKNRLQELGVSETKIVITSHVDCDHLFLVKQESSREDFNAEYSFDNGKKTIIVAPPQLYEEGYCPTWDDFSDELDFMIGSAAATGHNVLVVIHPKLSIKKFLFLEKKYGCKINRKRTSDAVPFGDIYVSGGSSTNFWAITCGLILVDMVQIYGHLDELFNYFSSVICVQTRNDLSEVLMRLCRDEEFYSRHKNLVEKDNKDYLLPLDGQVTTRCLSLIDSPVRKDFAVEGAGV